MSRITPKRLSFRNVSNCVIRLMQSVKFNAEIPFSNVLTPPPDESKQPGSKFVSILHYIYMYILVWGEIKGYNWLHLSIRYSTHHSDIFLSIYWT